MPSNSKPPSTKEIVDCVTRHYLASHDFNGFPAGDLLPDFGANEAAIKKVLSNLIHRGKISLNLGDTHPNPYILAFPAEAKDIQLKKLQNGGLAHICAYPTRSHLRHVVDPTKYNGSPFTLRLALGEPQLTFQTFDLGVLEFYRNDPRYYYHADDISGSISFHGKGSKLRASDQVLLQSFGFAYDAKLNRAVAVFLRYLSGLSSEHQQIWKAKALRGKYKLHPDYYRSTIGDWYEGVSIFDALLEEIHHVNEMCKLMGRPILFRKEFNEGTRPRGLGFLIRPTVREFNDFIHLLDKLLSDNINKDFFMNDIATESEHARQDGKIEVRRKGTIQMLEEWVTKKVRLSDPKPIDETVSAFREVRQLRQRPAHAIDEDGFDQRWFHKQREIMMRAYGAVRTVRLLFANHPKVAGYKVSETLQAGKIWTY